MAQRYEGRNLEEALTAASQALGVERYQLTYHVLLEKRGFLGGMKRVVIEAEVNTNAAPPEEVAPAVSEPRPPRADRGPRPSGGRRDGRGAGRGEGRAGGGGGRRRRRGERHASYDEEPREFETPVDVPGQGEESEAATTVHEWCDQVLRLARLSGEVRTEENETQIIVRIYGRDAAKLTERNGELLDALQVLANKALTGRKVEKDIEVDSAQFKERRIEELGERARATADRVRRDGREQVLPAMTPIERRIVHLALADDADVTTESRGEGFYKRVAIIPRSAAQQPES